MGVSEFMTIVRLVAACFLSVWALRAASRRDVASAIVAIVMWHALVTHP